nr:olfactory receptor 11 [Tropidothorax elegans]
MLGIQWPWEKAKLTDIWHWPIIFWLNIYGWWAEEAPTPFWRRWLWRLRFILLINVFFNFWGMIIAVIIKFSGGDIMANLFSVFAAGPGVVGTFKIVQCIRHRAILKQGMDLLDEMLSEVDEPELDTLVRTRLRKCWVGFASFLTFGSCITLHWLSRPLLLAIFYQEKTRIVDTWPVFIDTWTQWFFSYLFQGSNVCLCGHTFYIFDNIYFCMSENLLCHLEILKYRLTHLTLDGSNIADIKIEKYIRHHCQILRVCDKLKEASEGVILFQCINTVIMLCTGIFILLLMDGINMNVIMNLGEITLVVVCILFAYCWYSNEITYQCANLCKSGYMVDWVDGTQKQKTKLHNLMTMTMQPVIFGGIVEIDLNTFINVLKTTFSYYNFLVAAKESNEH